MAVILSRPICGKKCWACGQEIKVDEVMVVSTGAMEMVYMHQDCAEAISHRLVRDISELIDLGCVSDEEALFKPGEVAR